MFDPVSDYYFWNLALPTEDDEWDKEDEYDEWDERTEGDDANHD